MAVSTIGIDFLNLGVNEFGDGFLRTDLGSDKPLSLQTNGVERIRINENGMVTSNIGSSVLALNGTELVFKDDFISADDPVVLTNKTISSGSNTITITSAGESNINDILDQAVTTNSSVDFLDVTTVGGVFAGAAMECTQLQTGAINSPGLGNLCLINGVNPLTTDTNLNNHIADTAAHGATGAVVGTTNIQTITGKTISTTDNVITVNIPPGIDTDIVDLLNQGVRTFDNVNFADINSSGNIFSSGNGQFSQVLTNSVNDPSLTNTCTVNGVNPLTTDTNLNNHIVSTTAHGTTSAIVGINDVQRFSNKNIAVPSCKLVDNSDSTKVINFNCASSTTGTNTQLSFAQTANRVITFPDATTTVVGDTTTQTLTNKTLNSASNTMTITNSPLSAVNVNSLINQDIRTSATPSFSGATITTNQLAITGTKSSGAPAAEGIFIGTDTAPPNASVSMEMVSNGGVCYIDFTVPSVDSRGRIIYDTSANTLSINTNSALAVTFDSSQVPNFNADRILVVNSHTPSSSSAAGTAGSISWDSNYIYVCVATNSWKRAAILGVF